MKRAVNFLAILLVVVFTTSCSNSGVIAGDVCQIARGVCNTAMVICNLVGDTTKVKVSFSRVNSRVLDSLCTSLEEQAVAVRKAVNERQ